MRPHPAAITDAPEKAELTRLERLIAQWQTNYTSVGRALATIKSRNLHAATHLSWELYLAQRLDMTTDRAWRLVRAAEIHDRLKEAGATVLPTNESQALELSSVEPEAQAEVWAAVIARSPGGKPTTMMAALIVAERAGLPPGVGPDGSVSDDLASVLAGLPAATQARVVQEVERRANTVATHRERDAEKRAPWLSTWLIIRKRLEFLDELPQKPPERKRVLSLMNKQKLLLDRFTRRGKRTI
jgi:hypothetical protein